MIYWKEISIDNMIYKWSPYFLFYLIHSPRQIHLYTPFITLLYVYIKRALLLCKYKCIYPLWYPFLHLTKYYITCLKDIPVKNIFLNKLDLKFWNSYGNSFFTTLLFTNFFTTLSISFLWFLVLLRCRINAPA